jgi:hypothetical protein
MHFDTRKWYDGCLPIACNHKCHKLRGRGMSNIRLLRQGKIEQKFTLKFINKNKEVVVKKSRGSTVGDMN